MDIDDLIFADEEPRVSEKWILSLLMESYLVYTNGSQVPKAECIKTLVIEDSVLLFGEVAERLNAAPC